MFPEKKSEDKSETTQKAKQLLGQLFSLNHYAGDKK